MGHGNEIGRIGRREAPVDPRADHPEGPRGPLPTENTGVVPPSQGPGAPEHPAGLPELQDGYIPQPMTDVSAPLKGEGAALPKGVADILPDLTRMSELGQLPQRFASDMMLLRAQLSVPGIPRPEQADRLFQFFVAYAQRFVEMATAVEADAGAMNQGDPDAHPQDGGAKAKGQAPRLSGEVELSSLWGETVSEVELPAQAPRAYTPEEKATEVQRFTQALREAGFSELRDANTGRDGTRAAASLLLAKSPEAVERQAQQILLRPAPDAPQQAPARMPDAARLPAEQARSVARPMDSARPPDAARPLSVEGRPELRLADGGGMRVQPFALPVAQVASPVDPRADALDEPLLDRRATTNGRLGPKMFWNVLHTFRGHGDESAVFQDKWDKLTFGAILLLVLVTLIVVVLVLL